MDAKRPEAPDASRPPDDGRSDYERPFGWWGHHWSDPEPMSLPSLVQEETISGQEAAFLSLAIEARRSIVVIAGPPKAGKTTMLTSLIDFLPADVRRIYIRGLYERFEFVREDDPHNCYVLCNEVSTHLPTYLWGRGVRLLFDAIEHGFPMATTMHASSAEDALQQLSSFPLEVPVHQVALLDLVVTVDMDYVDNQLRRRVTGIAEIQNRQGRPYIDVVSQRDRLRASPRIDTGRMIHLLAKWHGTDDDRAARALAIRERFLDECQREGILGRDAVSQSIRKMREEAQ